MKDTSSRDGAHIPVCKLKPFTISVAELMLGEGCLVGEWGMSTRSPQVTKKPGCMRWVFHMKDLSRPDPFAALSVVGFGLRIVSTALRAVLVLHHSRAL